MFYPFARLTSQSSTDDYLEAFKLTGCYIYNINWGISVLICFHVMLPALIRNASFWKTLAFWFGDFCVVVLGTSELVPENWKGELHLDSRVAASRTLVFWGKNTVQRRRLGITALPAASQEPQLLLLLLLCFRNWHFSAHYWPSATLMAINRSGWVHSTPTQSWSSLPRGTKRKVYPTFETCASVTTQLSVLEESFQTTSFALQAMRAWEQWQNTTSSDQNLTSVDCTDKLACTKSAMKAQNNL